ncbi:MAG TPA: dihydropteroate synthase [Nitrospirota bacterium]|nr:dihydropteroate synthase [Nitrospirota bacterium]
MGPVLRISGRGALAITIYGLTPDQARRIREVMKASDVGAGIGTVPASSLNGMLPMLVLSGAPEQLKRLPPLFASDDSIPTAIPQKIETLLDNYLLSDYKIACGGKVLDLGSRTHIMGILNVTPDSFSDGGRFTALDRARAHAHEMAAAGADIIDIGGESTRPGAEPVPEDEELRRIIPVIKCLSVELPVPLSVDTYKASVARKALDAGASMVNDISGLRFSPDMAKVVADTGAALVIMHIKGTPHNMQQNPEYADVVGEVAEFLKESIKAAEKAGVKREKIIIDPGIGFGKNLTHNLQLLDRLDELKGLGRPIMLGTSRKKFIGTVLDIPVPDQRLNGTAATVALGIIRGASLVRVHEVAQMVQVARMTDAMVKADY